MDIKTQIVHLLIDSAPLSMSQIATKMKTDIQLINYHIKQLVDSEIIVCQDTDKLKKYTVYPILKETQLYDGIFAVLLLALPEFREDIHPTKNEKQNVILSCLKYILLKVVSDLNDTHQKRKS